MQAGRPKLLFLCHTLPHPPDGGVWIRSFHLLRILASEYQVTALCFERSGLSAKDHDVDSAIEALEPLCHLETFPVDQMRSRRRYVQDHLRSLFTRRPFTVYKHDSRPFLQRIQELLAAEDFDIIHVDSLDLSVCMPILTESGVPVVCGHHNVESQLLRRRAESEGNALVRAYVRRQASFTEREEATWAERVTVNVTVSPQDRETLRMLAPGSRVETVPNGVDVDYFSPPSSDEGSAQSGLVFVGSSGWFPNRDSMRYLTQDILPELRRRGHDPEVTWIGRASEAERIKYLGDGRVHMTGRVDDVRPYIERGACYVVPLRVGGGTRLKILDAWAMGKAVVSTSVGCEGLDARDGENILIRDEPGDFAEAIAAVLADTGLRRRLGEGGRHTVESTYSWDVVGREMLGHYQEIRGSGEVPRARHESGPGSSGHLRESQ